MRIEFLSAVPAFLEEVAAIRFAEWPDAYLEFGCESVSDVVEDIQERYMSADNRVPFMIVALQDAEDGSGATELIGTAAIDEDDAPSDFDYGDLKPGPWIDCVYVKPTYRGRGIANDLLHALLDQAAAIGIPSIFLWTEQLERYYLKQGFELLQHMEYNDRHVSVMRYVCPDLVGLRNSDGADDTDVAVSAAGQSSYSAVDSSVDDEACDDSDNDSTGSATPSAPVSAGAVAGIPAAAASVTTIASTTTTTNDNKKIAPAGLSDETAAAVLSGGSSNITSPTVGESARSSRNAATRAAYASAPVGQGFKEAAAAFRARLAAFGLDVPGVVRASCASELAAVRDAQPAFERFAAVPGGACACARVPAVA